MKALPVVVLASAIVLAACTYETTKVRQPAEAPPPPAPAVVVAPPPPAPAVVQAPTVVPAPVPGQIVVTYSGRGGFDLAQQKAYAACQDRGSGGARLVTDDGVGRATFDCL